MGKMPDARANAGDQGSGQSVIVTYTNTVGGQDELVFDGSSLIADQTGEIIARGKAFEEDLIDCRSQCCGGGAGTVWRRGERNPCLLAWQRSSTELTSGYRLESRDRMVVPALEPPHWNRLDEAYRALVLGVQDYVRKNGFKRVVIGLSGGVDSAMTAVVAVDALGPENVLGVFMPSPYTPEGQPRGCRRFRPPAPHPGGHAVHHGHV